MKNHQLRDKEAFHPSLQHSYHRFPLPSRYSENKEISLERDTKRLSPALHNRSSLASTSPAPAATSHIPTTLDVSKTSRISEFCLPPQNSKFIYELLQRIEKLEARNQRYERLELRVDRIQGKHMKLDARVESVAVLKQKVVKGKENQVLLESRLKEEQARNKGRPIGVTRDEMQKQLTNIFKSEFSNFKTLIRTEVSELNIKNKKKLIENTASQISEKLEQFKATFFREWHSQIDKVVKDTWSQEIVGKTVIGISREKFIGTALPVKVTQQLCASVGGVDQKLAYLENRYYIDPDGCLLDRNMFYLVDKDGKTIKIGQDKVELLKKYGVMQPQLGKTPFLSKSLSSL